MEYVPYYTNTEFTRMETKNKEIEKLKKENQKLLEMNESKKRKLDLSEYDEKEILEALDNKKIKIVTCPNCDIISTGDIYLVHSKHTDAITCDLCSYECPDPDCEMEYGTRVWDGNVYMHEDCRDPKDIFSCDRCDLVRDFDELNWEFDQGWKKVCKKTCDGEKS